MNPPTQLKLPRVEIRYVVERVLMRYKFSTASELAFQAQDLVGAMNVSLRLDLLPVLNRPRVVLGVLEPRQGSVVRDSPAGSAARGATAAWRGRAGTERRKGGTDEHLRASGDCLL